MRILHVTREIGDDRLFGMGRALAPLVEALAARGHEVRYLTQDEISPGEASRRDRWTGRLRRVLRPVVGEAAHMLGGVFGERLSMGLVAADRAHRIDADVVHLHDPWLALGFALGNRSWGATRRRWGLSQHGFGCYTEAIREEGVPTTQRLLRWQRRAEARVLQAARFVCSPTELALDQLRRDMALPERPAHWHVVPHALRIHSMERDEARRQLGVAPELPMLVAIGRLNPVKRMDQIVQAAVRTQLRVHLVILGANDAQDLHALLPVDGRVTLELKLVHDVAPWLSACDVYLSATRNESFGLANLEALACGAPAICTAVGGVPEVTGGAAWLIPGQDRDLVDLLAARLLDLLTDANLRRQWSTRARAHAARWPGADAVAQSHETIYRTLV